MTFTNITHIAASLTMSTEDSGVECVDEALASDSEQASNEVSLMLQYNKK